MKDKLNPFHLAIPVSNLEESVIYYRDILGLEEGRSSKKWADFNFFGHQLVCHVSDNINEQVTNPVDGEEVPVPHFGVVLSIEEFEDFLLKISDKDIDLLSNGFKPRTSNSALNTSGDTYIYMAIAAEPLVDSTGKIVATAR